MLSNAVSDVVKEENVGKNSHLYPQRALPTALGTKGHGRNSQGSDFGPNQGIFPSKEKFTFFFPYPTLLHEKCADVPYLQRGHFPIKLKMS
jgi:hypothetical protein